MARLRLIRNGWSFCASVKAVNCQQESEWLLTLDFGARELQEKLSISNQSNEHHAKDIQKPLARYSPGFRALLLSRLFRKCPIQP